MTPKEKAEELKRKFSLGGWGKENAIIAINEIIKAIDFDWMEVQNLEREHDYWNKVKDEIYKNEK